MNRRSPPRMLEVIAKQQVSRHMLRITFGGKNLNGFPTGSESANVKLLLAHPGQDWSAYLAALEGEGQKPLKRTYTVLEYREQRNELDIDIALHDKPGPATQWALNAKVGDQIALAGPGTNKLADFHADWFLFAGDLTALPAISANIKLLPASARGYIIVEIPDALDQRQLKAPQAMQTSWIINPDPGSIAKPLVSKVKSLQWLDGTPSVWVAGESDTVRTLRNYLASDKQLERQHRYTSGYWKLGDSEDVFQMVKRNEADL